MLKSVGMVDGNLMTIIVPLKSNSFGNANIFLLSVVFINNAFPESTANSPFSPSVIIFMFEDIPYPLFSALGKFFVEKPFWAKLNA